MRTHRILSTLLLAFLTFFLFSCGGADTETAEPEESSAVEIAAPEPEPEPEPEPAPAPAPEPTPAPAPEPEPESSALKIGYSDWPGWVAWEIAIQKKWFEDELNKMDIKCGSSEGNFSFIQTSESKAREISTQLTND